MGVAEAYSEDLDALVSVWTECVYSDIVSSTVNLG